MVLKDSHVPRNEWPLGLVTQVFPSRDGKVRTVEIKVTKIEGTKLFIRPITETVLFIPSICRSKVSCCRSGLIHAR